jgi:hypothetical protein
MSKERRALIPHSSKTKQKNPQPGKALRHFLKVKKSCCISIPIRAAREYPPDSV